MQRLWFFFFFKQTTAYVMRISDWSADVCSSDLAEPEEDPPGVRAGSNGLVVGPGCAPPSSAVTAFDSITAPACRSALTAALSRLGKLSSKAAQPIRVGMRSEERRVGKECVSTC